MARTNKSKKLKVIYVVLWCKNTNNFYTALFHNSNIYQVLQNQSVLPIINLSRAEAYNFDIAQM